MSDDSKNVIPYDEAKKVPRMVASDIAKYLDVPVPVISSFVAKGMPVYVKDNGMEMFNLRDCVRWYRNYCKEQNLLTKDGKEASQYVLREMIDAAKVIRDQDFIDTELHALFNEIKNMNERFTENNMRLLMSNGEVDKSKMDMSDFINDQTSRAAELKLKILLARRQGLDSMLRKKLPDLRTATVSEDDDPAKDAYNEFIEAASKA